MAVTTELTRQLKIQHPIMLAGMGQTSGSEMAAAVSNAGGLGVIGGVGYSRSSLTYTLATIDNRLHSERDAQGHDR